MAARTYRNSSSVITRNGGTIKGNLAITGHAKLASLEVAAPIEAAGLKLSAAPVFAIATAAPTVDTAGAAGTVLIVNDAVSHETAIYIALQDNVAGAAVWHKVALAV
jgi:hypothetical protein